MTELRERLQAALGNALELDRELGGGGMSQVFLARDPSLGRDVVIKVLSPELAAEVSVERFTREIRTAAGLQHPQIVTVLSAGNVDGLPYYTMPYIAGETLRGRIAAGPLGHREAIEILRDIAKALAFAHGRGIAHRDIKPDNVLLTDDSAVVTGFGIAKAIVASQAPGAHAPTLTQAGVTLGTPAYMAPEQATADPTIDHRADLYAFGCVAYEMLTGAPPFTGRTAAALIAAHLTKAPPSVAAARPDVPSPLGRLVDQCLAKDPDLRVQSAADCLALLDQAAAELSGARVVTPQGEWKKTPGERPEPSLAVLPFADMSPQKDQEYFCDGMADELINALAKLPNLRVVSRTSAFRFRGAADIQQTGALLGVQTVLEGSVRTAGSRLRISAQLVNVADACHLWSERYDRQMDDVFDVQDEIARAIVSALKVKLLGDEGTALIKRGADNVEAYNLCLKARHYWYRWTPEGFAKALQLFEQAVQLDPNCAIAHFGVADCHAAAAFSGVGVVGAATCKAGLEAAIALDPELAEAHGILSLVQGLWMHDWPAAQRSVETAMRINPRSPHVLNAYALLQTLLVREDEAVAAARRAVEIDPLAPFWGFVLAETYYSFRHYDDAVQHAEATLDLAPGYVGALWVAGLSQLALGDHAKAIEALEAAMMHSGRVGSVVGYCGAAYARAGRRADAERLLGELLASDTATVSIACIYAGLGDAENAFVWLERGYVRQDFLLTHLLGPFSVLDSLRADARFDDLRRRIGLTSVS